MHLWCTLAPIQTGMGSKARWRPYGRCTETCTLPLVYSQIELDRNQKIYLSYFELRTYRTICDGPLNFNINMYSTLLLECKHSIEDQWCPTSNYVYFTIFTMNQNLCCDASDCTAQSMHTWSAKPKCFHNIQLLCISQHLVLSGLCIELYPQDWKSIFKIIYIFGFTILFHLTRI